MLSALPKRLHAQAKELIHAISYADTRTAAVTAYHRLVDELSAHPKAVAKITRDLDALLTFYDFPAEHWKHLRTTNPIESTFSTVRLRARVSRGAGSRDAAVAMGFKLLEAAQDRWRRVDGAELVALVRAGVKSIDGKLVERDDTTTEEDNQDHHDQECAA